MKQTIKTYRSKPYAKKRNKRVALARMATFRMRVPVMIEIAGQAQPIERSWVIECPNRQALAYARLRIAECIRGMNGVRVIPDEVIPGEDEEE